jgi:hypothetical protein
VVGSAAAKAARVVEPARLRFTTLPRRYRGEFLRGRHPTSPEDTRRGRTFRRRFDIG